MILPNFSAKSMIFVKNLSQKCTDGCPLTNSAFDDASTRVASGKLLQTLC